MLEWLKRYAWKAYVLLKGTGGSNPFLSAKYKEAVSKLIQPLFVIMRQDTYFEDKNNQSEGYFLCEKQ